MASHRQSLVLAAGTALLVPLASQGVRAQSLHGSRASINRMYRHARSEHFSFFETARGVRHAVAAGWLVRLTPDSNFVLHEVGYPFVRPATRTFVTRLAAQYVAACGEPLVVTSAVRPATRQPPNSTARSVHPTGMAVDLRKPQDAPCLHWLRSTLLELEDDGLLEATEEWSPPHFHVAVFTTPYTRYVARRERAEHATHLASGAAAHATPYTVRAGDTLWSIAHEYDTSVEAITQANDLDDDTIRPGQELRIPNGA